jgi:hypothetical protein
MHPPSPHPLADTLLRHLECEEALLRDALAGATEIYEALRRGDLAAAQTAATRQPELGTALAAAAAARTTAAHTLASELGLACEEITLAALAAKLPESETAKVLAVRSRLTALATELTEVQTRNANLVVHLRSYFRGVLADLVPETPSRYGASGSRLEPATAVAVQARG